jgi:hypothetical protein
MERDYIVGELLRNRVIENVMSYRSGQRLPRVNHYITDGQITVGELSRINVGLDARST